MMRIFKKTIVAFAIILISHDSFAGFCDNQGALQTIEDIHLFGGRAYVTFSPGFAAGGEAESCSRTIASLDITNESSNPYYSMLLMSQASGKKVQFTYCGACSAHAYNGPSVQVPTILGLSLRKQ